MSDGSIAQSHPEPKSIWSEIVDAVEAFFDPINLFRLSFLIAAFLCAVYSIVLPIRFYFATEKVLLSDTSVYYFLSAIGMFLTEKALKEYDKLSRPDK
jgi:hypothetical protein